MAITVLDERQLIGKLSTFVAISPDKMPSVRFCEGDFSLLWTKLSKLDKMVSILAEGLKEISDKMDQITDTLKFMETMRSDIDSLKQLAAINTCRPVQMSNWSSVPGTQSSVTSLTTKSSNTAGVP